MNDFIQTWFPVFLAFATAGCFLFTMWVRQVSKDEAEQISDQLRTDLEREVKALRDAVAKELAALQQENEKLERSVINHDRRLIAVEKGLEAFPTTRDIKHLERQLSEISGKMEGMSSQLNGVKEGQNRTEDAINTINAALISSNFSRSDG